MRMNTQSHIEEIKQLLDSFEIDAHTQEIKSDAYWTYEIKKRLGELGEKHAYKVCTSGFTDYYESAWLYDLVWYREEGEGEKARLIEVPLVMESEWDLRFSYIKYDFEKLLLANAGLRLMICNVYQDYKDKIVSYFMDAISKYRQGKVGDIFLIAMLDYDTEKFHYELIKK